MFLKVESFEKQACGDAARCDGDEFSQAAGAHVGLVLPSRAQPGAKAAAAFG